MVESTSSAAAIHPSNQNKKSLAVLGTGSDVGKSILAAGICRVLSNHHQHQHNHHVVPSATAATAGKVVVAPFKAQNMSNNAYPALTPQGDYGEIGIAQAIQARACRQVPRVEVRVAFGVRSCLLAGYSSS